MDKEAMRRVNVKSSNIKSIGHNFLTKNMEIEFNGGNIYRYKKVPRHVFKDMLDSDSKGKFFWQNIRFDYPYKKYKDKDGNKVKEEWRMLERKDKKRENDNEKVASARTTAAGAIVGGVSGLVRGAGSAILSDKKMSKKERLKMALKEGLGQGAIGAGAGAAVGATNDVLNATLLKKKASEVLDDMYKEATMLNPTGAMFALNSAQKNISKAYNKGAGGMVGAEARKAGMASVGQNANKIMRRSIGSAVAGNLLETVVNNTTQPVYEDDYGRQVAASEILDEMYKEAIYGE